MRKYTQPENEEMSAYDMAYKKVKRIKGFYTHLSVYLLINMVIVGLNISELKPGESYFQWQNFATLFFWGIGLLAHGLSVFMPYFVFGKNWEERKIKELMEKEKNHNWE
jgi:hypothetical protein